MPVDVRPATSADEASIVALLDTALGRTPDPRNLALHRWKHDESAFGPSPRWVAEVDGELAGVRLFLRWRLRGAGRTWSAVQAVDTATDERFRRRGVFRTLTLGAVDALRDEGVDLVFNTPNANSRPGYLKLGWRPAPPLRPRFAIGARHVPAFLRDRRPASVWGEPTDVGEAPEASFADEGRWAGLLAGPHGGGDPDRLGTDRSLAYLRWRFPGPLLGYRVLHQDGSAAIFRLRRRGRLLEATVGDVFGPPSERRALLRAVRRSTGADLLMAIGSGPGDGLHRYPGGARQLVLRPLADHPALAEPAFQLTMGDVEIF